MDDPDLRRCENIEERGIFLSLSLRKRGGEDESRRVERESLAGVLDDCNTTNLAAELFSKIISSNRLLFETHLVTVRIAFDISPLVKYFGLT